MMIIFPFHSPYSILFSSLINFLNRILFLMSNDSLFCAFEFLFECIIDCVALLFFMFLADSMEFFSLCFPFICDCLVNLFLSNNFRNFLFILQNLIEINFC